MDDRLVQFVGRANRLRSYDDHVRRYHRHKSWVILKERFMRSGHFDWEYPR